MCITPCVLQSTYAPGANITCYYDPGNVRMVTFSRAFSPLPIAVAGFLAILCGVMVHWLCFIRANAAALGTMLGGKQVCASHAHTRTHKRTHARSSSRIRARTPRASFR